MTPIERARYYIDNIRFNSKQLDEPLRSELHCVTIALAQIVTCIERPAEASKPEPPMTPISQRWTETV